MKKELTFGTLMIEMPKACQVTLDKMMGMMPLIMQNEVMKKASNLALPASMTASRNGIQWTKINICVRR